MRVNFVSLGLLYAGFSIVAELRYARAADESLPISIRVHNAAIAASDFPLDPRLRKALAEFYSVVRWPGSREQAIPVLRAALEDDPFAFDIRRNLAGYLLEDGDRPAAEREIAFIHAFSPRSQIVLHVNVNPATGGSALRPSDRPE